MPPNYHPVDKEAGKRLRAVRKYLKMSQAAFADLLGISQTMVSYIEKGEREVPTHVLKTLFLKHNISPTYIITGIRPLEYGKDERGGLVTNVSDLQAELEIIKSHIKLLQRNKRLEN